MRKFACLLLLSWLPVFMTVAHAMSMQMAWNSLAPSTESTQVGLAHHDCHSDAQDAEGKTPIKHVCVACGMCVISHAVDVKSIEPMQLISMQASQPPSLTAAFTSKRYPPAIKPPISN